MKQADLVNLLRSENEEYRNLELEHKKLEHSLEEIGKKKYLTTDEEIEKKKIQKQKLQFKDRMALIIREYGKK